MKKLLFTLLLIPALSWAGITQIIVSKNTIDEEIVYSAQAYGLTDDGSPKLVAISGAQSIKDSKVQSFVDHFSLARDFARYIIYFNGDGTVANINFQLADPFFNQPIQKMDQSAAQDLATFKAYVETALKIETKGKTKEELKSEK